MVTSDKREMADRMRKENRISNDSITTERRIREDKARDESRLKNDEMTANRRRLNDRNPWRTFAIWLLIIAVLALGAYYLFYLK